jgi:hypothetical protein
MILTNYSFKKSISQTRYDLKRLSTSVMRVNVSNSQKFNFIAEKMKYLGSGYLITRQGIQPILNKFEAFLHIKAPKNYYYFIVLAKYQKFAFSQHVVT